MKDYLFAYGTLAKNNAPLEIAATVKRLKIVGEGYVFARLYDLGDYPGAVLDHSQRSKVFGKILELPADAKLLGQLDTYEAFDPRRPADSLFVRKRTAINRRKQPQLIAWIYEYNRDVKPFRLINSGHYSKVSA